MYRTLVRGGRYPPFGQKPNYFRFFHLKISLNHFSHNSAIMFSQIINPIKVQPHISCQSENSSVHLPRSSVWVNLQEGVHKTAEVSSCTDTFFPTPKLSVDLLRSSVLCQKFEGVRKLSVHLLRSSVCCPGSENCPSNC